MWPCVVELVVSDLQEEGVACVSKGEVVHALEFSRLENEGTMFVYILKSHKHNDKRCIPRDTKEHICLTRNIS
jgi:hypothetical protein